MIFYAPFNGEKKKLPGSQEWLQNLAKEAQCVVFALRIPPSTQIKGHSQYFIYPESGWHEMVFLAQKKVAEKLGIPAGKLLITGESSGGSMAQQLCNGNPEKFTAAAWAGGSRYSEEINPRDHAPRLIINTYNCPGESPSRRYGQLLRDQGVAVLNISTPPDFSRVKAEHHALNKIVYQLITAYLSGIAELERNSGGQLPPESEWPVRSAQGEYFPSHEFVAIWNEAQPKKSPPNAKLLAVVIADENEPLLREFIYTLGEYGVKTISVSIQGGEFRNVATQYRKELTEHLKDNALPVICIGIGSEAQIGVIAALQLPQNAIQKFILFDMPLDSPFDERRIAKWHKLNPVTVVSYGNSDIQEFPGIVYLPLTERSNREYAMLLKEATQP